MPGVAHQVFNRMFVPTVILGIWAYAHFESIRAEGAKGAWREENVMRTGNPCTTPVPPRPIVPPDLDSDDDGDGAVASAGPGS